MGEQSLRDFFGSPAFQVIWSRRQPDRDVRTLQFQFEDLFKPLITAPTVATQLPAGAPLPAAIPRFSMSDGTRTLAVANNSLALVQNFTSPPSKGFDGPLTKVAPLMEEASKILGYHPPYFGELIISVDFPLLKKTEGLKAIVQHATKFPSDDPALLVSFGQSSLHGGFSHGVDLQTVLNFHPSRNPVFIDADFEPATSEVVKFRVAVSSKPAADMPPADLFATLKSRLPSVAKSNAPSYLPGDLARELLDQL